VSVADKVIDIVSAQMGVGKETISMETSVVELLMEFEEKFDLSIPDEEAEKIQTIGDAVKYIEERA